MKKVQSMPADHAEPPTQNPIQKLLGALPEGIYKEKWPAIKRELNDAGMWEHFRQFVRKPGQDLGRANIRTVVILKRHLGLTDNFFVGSLDEQENDIERIAKQYYNQLLSPA